MKTLITGATGFVGTHLVKRLKEKGDDVTCFVKGNIYDYSQYDIIYHLAGVLGKKGIPIEVHQEPTINMTIDILDQMHKEQKLIYVSTQSVVLPPSNSYHDDYIETKRQAEKIISYYDIQYRIIRPGFIYGKGDYHHLPLFRLIKNLGMLFPIIGSGKNIINPTYIKDVINIIEHAFDYHCHVIPIAGEPITMNEFIREVASQLKVSKPWYHIPAIKQEPIADILKTEFFTVNQSFESIITPTPLKQGLNECINWYKKGR